MKIALKNIVRTFFVLTLVLSFSAFIAQAEVIKIKTNAHCDACKKTIESGLKKVDGIQKVNVTLKDKVAAVEFDAKKINTNKIKKPSPVYEFYHIQDVEQKNYLPGNSIR